MERSSALPQNWWETCAYVSRVFSQRDNIPLRQTISQLDDYKELGVGCIEIFAPYHGGNQYGALDPINYYIVDPAIGVMEDFLTLVEQCHKRGMAVIIFINVGYAAMNNAEFIKAQDDIRRGIDSRETRLFLWDDGSSTYTGSLSSHFGKKSEGYWQLSEQANKYYWVKWRGSKNDVALPQYNFGNAEWREECKKIMRFWMDTGIDGVIIDAPYSYVNCDFAANNECITDIVREYPNQYIQPEGGGAAGEGIERWLTDARYNSVQDYSIYQGWFKQSIVEDVIKSGDASLLEKKLQSWRDKAADLGGTTYLGVHWNGILTPEQRLLEITAIVTTGAMAQDDDKLISADLPADIKKKIAAVLKLCSSEPALRLNGKREVLSCGDCVYAFKRFDGKGNTAVVALNFSDKPRHITLSLPGLVLKDAFTGARATDSGSLKIELGAYGYAVFKAE